MKKKLKKNIFAHIDMKLKILILGLALIFGSCLGKTSTGLGIESDNSIKEKALSKNNSSTSSNQFQPGDKFISSELLADVSEKRVQSVVNISSTRIIQRRRSPFFSDPFFRHFFGPRMPRRKPDSQHRAKSLGSGVIVSKDGIILTNNHVVKKSFEIKVNLSDGREYKAEIVGTDPKTDIAVLRIKGKVKNLKPVPFGNSAKLKLGNMVLAIGNPFGFGHTVTMGIVSAKGRANVGLVDYEDFIQTDAAINPGNSGGALINLKGELIGINTAIASKTGGYQGIGFAIPSNMAKKVLDSILKHGKVYRGWLGVVIQQVNPHLGKALKLKVSRGVIISDVMSDSPAMKAGLKRRDVIVEIDSIKIKSTGQLRNIIAMKGVGKKIKIKVLRNGKYKIVKVTLEKLQSGRKIGFNKTPDQGVSTSGIKVRTLDSELRKKLSLPSSINSGVLITSVQRGFQAWTAGLRPGDVVIKLNRKKVDSASQFDQRFNKVKSPVVLLVYRDGKTIYFVIRK
ncbi:MAG: DegQ family serine endoprotease [Deltaproteobacteria bacterium]|jgi:serine protease Do|nr:DegQ family serine endoprotease [Deltaproteobacteria bacterium]